MILAKLIFWFIVFSMISILILMGLGRNVHQAVQIVASFWKSIFIDVFNELFGTGKAYYPLVFGIGKDGYFYPSMIDSAFKDFYELFGGKKNIYCFNAYYSCEDIVSYAFDVYVDPENECVDKLQKKMEMCLKVMVNNQFKEYGIYNVLPEPFIYFEFDNEDAPTFLRVSFARTQKGVALISNQKRRVALEHQRKKRNSSFSFETDWESGEDTD